jgi:hypothetical protein
MYQKWGFLLSYKQRKAYKWEGLQNPNWPQSANSHFWNQLSKITIVTTNSCHGEYVIATPVRFQATPALSPGFYVPHVQACRIGVASSFPDHFLTIPNPAAHLCGKLAYEWPKILPQMWPGISPILLSHTLHIWSFKINYPLVTQW